MKVLLNSQSNLTSLRFLMMNATVNYSKTMIFLDIFCLWVAKILFSVFFPFCTQFLWFSMFSYCGKFATLYFKFVQLAFSVISKQRNGHTCGCSLQKHLKLQKLRPFSCFFQQLWKNAGASTLKKNASWPETWDWIWAADQRHHTNFCRPNAGV